jgi:hypothetical protein
MNLVSCDDCGVVLDKDKLVFPDTDQVEDDETGTYDPDAIVWNPNGSSWCVWVPCPVCGGTLFGPSL